MNNSLRGEIDQELFRLMTKRHQSAKLIFDDLNCDNHPVCTWLSECEEPVVGAGVFCDPLHKWCRVEVICERHRQEHLHNLRIAIEEETLYG